MQVKTVIVLGLLALGGIALALDGALLGSTLAATGAILAYRWQV